MSQSNTLIRSLNDVGLAAWLGGSLAGAVGFNGAAADVEQRDRRLEVATAAWDRWTPVNFAAIAAHLIGAGGLTWVNKGRVATQRGVGGVSVAKGVLTGAALAATGYSRALGSKLKRAGHVPVEGGTAPGPDTPPEVASAQRQLKVAQWVIPTLTGAIAVLNAVHGEQQRPGQVLSGIAARAGDGLKAVA